LGRSGRAEGQTWSSRSSSRVGWAEGWAGLGKAKGWVKGREGLVWVG